MRRLPEGCQAVTGNLRQYIRKQADLHLARHVEFLFQAAMFDPDEVIQVGPLQG